jgi:ribosomal protein L40E
MRLPRCRSASRSGWWSASRSASSGAVLDARAGLGALPDGHGRARAMLGLGALCGIGFTMSLFIASLAYGDRLRYDEVGARVSAFGACRRCWATCGLRAGLCRPRHADTTPR